MKKNVLAPNVGESITEVSILKWHKQSGQAVKSGEVLLEIESDKATVEIVAENDGTLTTLKAAGERIPVGEVIGNVDDSVKATIAGAASTPSTKSSSAPSAPAPSSTPAPSMPAASSSGAGGAFNPGNAAPMLAQNGAPLPPSVRRAMLDGSHTGNVQNISSTSSSSPASSATARSAPSGTPSGASVAQDGPGVRRVPMSALRSRIAERLKNAQETAAILTTFNECDMSAVMALRNQHKDAFKAKHGVPLSFMSFFARASVEALKAVPSVNAAIEGRDIVYRDFHDIGIAVGTERGLVVPVVRGAEKMNFVDIERRIGELAVKARDGKLSIADMSGGTFTISNGGVYGSLLSTPILNPPQSGILGMHKIMDRAVVINGKVEARPMMYLALSYDHRLIDGKEAVTFLIKVKEGIENPSSLGFSV